MKYNTNLMAKRLFKRKGYRNKSNKSLAILRQTKIFTSFYTYLLG